MLATIDGNGKVGAGGIGPGTDWYHDPITFHHNEDLITAVSAQADLLKAAVSKCAGAIESLVDGGGRHGENGGPGFSTVTAPKVEDAPWGHVMTQQEMNELWEQQASGWERGASKQAMATGAGLLSYVGFDTSQFDPSSGLPHRPFSTGWSVHNAVTTWEATAQVILHHPLKTLAGAAKDFTAWDDWDRPGFAAGEVGFNLLTLGLASAKIGSIGKVGKAGSEAVDAARAGKLGAEAGEASRLARLAEIGQRSGAKVTTATVDGFKVIARTGSNAWSKTLDRLDRTLHRGDFKVEKANTSDSPVPTSHDRDLSPGQRSDISAERAAPQAHDTKPPQTTHPDVAVPDSHRHDNSDTGSTAAHHGADTKVLDRTENGRPTPSRSPGTPGSGRSTGGGGEALRHETSEPGGRPRPAEPGHSAGGETPDLGRDHAESDHVTDTDPGTDHPGRDHPGTVAGDIPGDPAVLPEPKPGYMWDQTGPGKHGSSPIQKPMPSVPVPETSVNDIRPPANHLPQEGQSFGDGGEWKYVKRGASGAPEQAYITGRDRVDGKFLEYVLPREGRKDLPLDDLWVEPDGTKVTMEVKGNYNWPYTMKDPESLIRTQMNKWVDQAADQADVLGPEVVQRIVVTHNPELVPRLTAALTRRGVNAEVYYVPYRG